ncbi:hypothetical protein ABIB94_005520 [Bradyrhizobium sp. JR7.2]
MPGLVPGIHVLSTTWQGVDGRDKPGHDAAVTVGPPTRERERGGSCCRPNSIRTSTRYDAVLCAAPSPLSSSRAANHSDSG